MTDLTPSQAQVLDSLLKTWSVSESARELNMRREAVGMHLVRARRKYGCKNWRILLFKWAEFRRAHD
jgi:DNA-binding CsgD family transcriptional regulator